MAKRPTGRDARRYKSDIKKLKRLGLYEPKSDTVTAYGKKQTKRFADVLSGRSSVVKTTDIVARRYRKQGFQTHGDKVVIPQKPSTLPRYNKTSRKITVRVRHRGEFRRSEILPVRVGNLEKIREVDTNKYYLSLPLRRFGSNTTDYMNYDDANELWQDISQYSRKIDLLQYVILVPRDPNIPRSGKSPFPHAYRGNPRV